MNSLPTSLRYLLLATLLTAGPCLRAASASDLAEAKAKLLEAYQNGRTDSDNQVKQLREKIAALEYVAANRPHNPPTESARVVSVDFKGGPAGTLFTTINSDPDSGLNIIGEKADLAVELPPFSIRNADASALANGLDTLLRQRGYTLQGNQRPAPGLAAVFVLRKLAPYEIPGGQVLPFQSYQLAPYMEFQTVDDIIGAIRAGWELDPANDKNILRLKFHPATAILLVSAPPQGLGVVQTVLQQLRKGAEPSAKPKAETTPAPAKR